jgi:hypothetical protein
MGPGLPSCSELWPLLALSPRHPCPSSVTRLKWITLRMTLQVTDGMWEKGRARASRIGQDLGRIGCERTASDRIGNNVFPTRYQALQDPPWRSREAHLMRIRSQCRVGMNSASLYRCKLDAAARLREGKSASSQRPATDARGRCHIPRILWQP